MNDSTPKDLWTPRSIDDTRAMYDAWASGYEADIAAAGYATPARVAAALARYVGPTQPVLDFGCGTGLSGLALKEAGFEDFEGSDLSADMLAQARAKEIYKSLSLTPAGELPTPLDRFKGIAAAGVISSGAAPPETLSQLVGSCAPKTKISFSFNSVTLESGLYMPVFDALLASQKIALLERETGPHLPAKGITSDVFVIDIL